MQYWSWFHLPFSYIFFSFRRLSSILTKHYVYAASASSSSQMVLFLSIFSKQMNVNMAHGNHFLTWPVDSRSVSSLCNSGNTYYGSACIADAVPCTHVYLCGFSVRLVTCDGNHILK